MIRKTVLIGSLIAVCGVGLSDANAEIRGKYYDPEYTTNVAEACDSGSDSIVEFGTKSIEFHENSCKLRKVERWPNNRDIFEFHITCATGERNQLMVEESANGIWVQWRKGPMSNTAGVVYKKCPASPLPATSESLPKKVGKCVQTTIAKISDRFGHAVMISPDDGSGTMVLYANGGQQVSYGKEAAAIRSKVGDRVKMCLTAIPDHCPPGDERGKVYESTNLRTGETWAMPDAQHHCGGA